VILTHDIAAALDGYDYSGLQQMGQNSTCGGCNIAGSCGKGCPAAVISRGGRIGYLDSEQCPIVSGPVVLPLPRVRA
jgi:radical SAM protein with 4Fe4S-binding SPASM domain